MYCTRFYVVIEGFVQTMVCFLIFLQCFYQFL
nr:MAG TPA: hypothetical protein [Caudoviricetes sp.]